MAKKPRILFVCTGNSARSQMAEGLARFYGGNSIELESAGIDPAGLNPNAVWAMHEVGMDISHQTSDSLDSKNLEEFDYVVTLCGDARESCPVLPAHIKTEHWPLPDPAEIPGSLDDVIKGFRVIRYQIEHRVKNLLAKIEKSHP